MPATRSRTSTEQPEVALEDVKNSDLDDQNEEDKSVDKSEEDVNENTTSTTTDEKEVEESEDNSNDVNDSKDSKDANGEDKFEEKVENGSSKRKSEAGEGDVPDSTDIATEIMAKKAKVDAKADDESDAVEGDAPVVEQSA